MSKLGTFLLSAVVATTGYSTIAAKPVSAAEVCNYRNKIIYVATSSQNADGVWVSEGWWTLVPGDCLTYPDKTYTYLKLEESKSPDRSYEEQFTETAFCVVHDRFIVYNAIEESACKEADGKMETFLDLSSYRELVQ